LKEFSAGNGTFRYDGVFYNLRLYNIALYNCRRIDFKSYISLGRIFRLVIKEWFFGLAADSTRGRLH
jgi:hypothetical protein